MIKVAARFGVSSSYMARVCTLLNVPRPERGYWAKLAVGKAPKQPALPKPWAGNLLEWSRDGTPARRARPLPKPPDKIRHKPRKHRQPLPDRHPLTSDAKSHFEAGRLSYSAEYLKPAKRLLVDLAVTKTGLDKALYLLINSSSRWRPAGTGYSSHRIRSDFTGLRSMSGRIRRNITIRTISGHRSAAQSSISEP